MAGKDNSFEQQMIDFYGLDEISKIIHKKTDGITKSSEQMALSIIFNDIKKKYYDEKDIDRQINKFKIELYNQLEIDRQNGKNI